MISLIVWKISWGKVFVFLGKTEEMLSPVWSNCEKCITRRRRRFFSEPKNTYSKSFKNFWQFSDDWTNVKLYKLLYSIFEQNRMKESLNFSRH